MKLRGKLILSCAALAAVATTAFSTTYAWYTANSTVTATGISASTAAAASDALQISLDGEVWGATVDLTNALNGKNALAPVERTANSGQVGTYKTWVGDTNSVSTTAAAADGKNYVQFDLYFRNVGTTSNINITGATITNAKAATLPSQKLLADIDTYTTKTNSVYTVDLLRALDLEIVTKTASVSGENKTITVSNLADGAFGATNSGNVLVYRLADNPASTDTLDTATGYNAHTYYNDVKGIGYNKANPMPTDATTFAAYGAGKLFTKSVTGGVTSYTAATEYAANTVYYVNTGKTGINEDKNGDYYTGTTAANATTGIMTQTATAFDTTAETGNSLLPLFAPAKTANAQTGVAPIKIANTTEAMIVKTTWTIYLNGWDKACFDAVKGQNITMDLTFDALAATPAQP